MSSLRVQCDFMSSVVQHAILLGMNREQFDKLADTAWLVLTAEPAESEPALPAGETSAGTWTCARCSAVNAQYTDCNTCGAPRAAASEPGSPNV